MKGYLAFFCVLVAMLFFVPPINASQTDNELQYFSAVQSDLGKAVELQWATVTPNENIAYFDLWRLSENFSGFQKIATIDGNGTLGRFYAYTDNDAALGENYYQLVVHFEDGPIEWSKVVQYTKIAIHTVEISYPEVCKDLLLLSDRCGIMTIYNEKGKAINVRYTAKDKRLELKVDALPKGVYKTDWGDSFEILQ